ncbi:hypothetical protein OUZ56_033114 [Daphnia magna]|uniref:Uncharacterized protein n=1 Tax=Daphnia magna TaxID=35525 RepID=A0ABR0BA75_9CRUS|nr:hypothetical protein OUZ56_033114 [Daphnia magna]
MIRHPTNGNDLNAVALRVAGGRVFVELFDARSVLPAPIVVRRELMGAVDAAPRDFAACQREFRGNVAICGRVGGGLERNCLARARGLRRRAGARPRRAGVAAPSRFCRQRKSLPSARANRRTSPFASRISRQIQPSGIESCRMCINDSKPGSRAVGLPERRRPWRMNPSASERRLGTRLARGQTARLSANAAKRNNNQSWSFKNAS